MPPKPEAALCPHVNRYSLAYTRDYQRVAVQSLALLAKKEVELHELARPILA